MSSMHIETDRLILREMYPDDLDAVHEWRSDPEVARYMDFEPATQDQSREFLEGCLSANAADPREAYILAIVEKASGTAIGWIGWGAPSAPKVDAGDIDFGYALRTASWGRGYGTESLRAVIAYCHDELGVRTFFGETDVRNARSARVMEKAGMEPMGIAPWDETSLWFRSQRA